MEYTDYQLNQYILKVFKRFKQLDRSVNLAVINQDEISNYFINVDGEQQEVVMIMIVTGDVIGRKQLDFYFDIKGVFCYYQTDGNYKGKLEGNK